MEISIILNIVFAVMILIAGVLYQIWLGRTLLKAKKDIKENHEEFIKTIDETYSTIDSRLEDMNLHTNRCLDKLDSRLDSKFKDSHSLILEVESKMYDELTKCK